MVLHLCRKCRKQHHDIGIYCAGCRKDLISSGIASKILGISVTRFHHLVNDDQFNIEEYPYRSQVRYSKEQIESLYQRAQDKFVSLYQIQPLKPPVRKWSHFFLKCKKCKSTTNPHAKSGYCIQCYSAPNEWQGGRFKKCRVCKSAVNAHVIAGYCNECYKKSNYFLVVKHYKEGLNYQEIANKLNITRERVRQILKKSIESKSIEINSKKVSSLAELKVEGRKKRVKQIWMEIIDKNYDRYMNLARGYYSVNMFCQDQKIPQTAKFVFEEYYPEIFNIINSREKRWSSSYDKCMNCGTESVPHKMHGYCKNCYFKSIEYKTVQKKSRLKNIERVRAYTKEYTKLYNSRPEIKLKNYLKNDQLHFDGNREKALIRDSYICTSCGMTRKESYDKSGKDLLVRHMDNNPKNNELDNLKTYCQRCFTKDATAYYLQNNN